MKNCLDEKALLSLHDGDGSPEDRAHVESCLSCARRYRQLADDLKDIVEVLKQPPPPQASRHWSTSAGLRWSMAAAIVGVAFLLGRMTTVSAIGASFFHHAAQPATQVAAADLGPAAGGDTTIASAYGMYVDNLIGQEDDADPNQMAVEDTWTNDSDGL